MQRILFSKNFIGLNSYFSLQEAFLGMLNCLKFYLIWYHQKSNHVTCLRFKTRHQSYLSLLWTKKIEENVTIMAYMAYLKWMCAYWPCRVKITLIKHFTYFNTFKKVKIATGKFFRTKFNYQLQENYITLIWVLM